METNSDALFSGDGRCATSERREDNTGGEHRIKGLAGRRGGK